LTKKKKVLQEQAVVKKEYDELKKIHEKYKLDFLRTLQHCKDLESKLNILEEENSNLRKTLAFQKDKFDDMLRQKSCTFNKEIKYKDSKLKYYENVAHSMKGVYNFYNDNETTLFSKALSSLNEEKDLRKSVQTHKSISPFRMKYSIQDPKASIPMEKTITTNKNDVTQTTIKSEIDHLDMEINELKNQIKTKMVI